MGMRRGLVAQQRYDGYSVGIPRTNSYEGNASRRWKAVKQRQHKDLINLIKFVMYVKTIQASLQRQKSELEQQVEKHEPQPEKPTYFSRSVSDMYKDIINHNPNQKPREKKRSNREEAYLQLLAGINLYRIRGPPEKRTFFNRAINTITNTNMQLGKRDRSHLSDIIREIAIDIGMEKESERIGESFKDLFSYMVKRFLAKPGASPLQQKNTYGKRAAYFGGDTSFLQSRRATQEYKKPKVKKKPTST